MKEKPPIMFATTAIQKKGHHLPKAVTWKSGMLPRREADSRERVKLRPNLWMDTKDKDYSKANLPFNCDHRAKNVGLPPLIELDFSAMRATEEAV